MELDELKIAWTALDRRLARQDRLNLQLFRDRKLDQAHASLRPLFWGQVAQMVFGVLFIVLAVSFWPQHRAEPLLLFAGLIVQAYGVAIIVAAGVTLGSMSGMRYDAPVLDIQKQCARLRKHYLVSGMVAGLPWWVLWVPMLIVLAGLAGDVPGQAWAVSFLAISTGIGVAGLLATWAFHRWAHRPSRARFGERLDEAAAGGSIRRMQRLLDEIARFERED
jgi:hypothetical protein